MNKTLGDRFFQVIERQKPFPNSSSASNLPSISLNQLEKQVNNIRKKKNQPQNNDDSSVMNNKEFHVCSPFYDRMKAHKQNCKCPYHKKQRFSLLPVRHTDKMSVAINMPFKKHNQHEQQTSFYRFSSKQHHRNSQNNLLNKSLDQLQGNRLSHTLTFAIKPKIDTRNITYESFLKDCEYHLLKKKGFALGKPAHIVRKGVKEIFQFINSHLDYTHEKMTQWVNTIQKDKDYGEFYMERFRQMKQNYELGLRKNRMNKAQLDDKNIDYFSRTNKSTKSNFKSNKNLSSLIKETNKFVNYGAQEQQKQSNYDGDDRNGLSQGEQGQNTVKMSQIFLNKIFDELMSQGTISEQMSQDLMKLDLKSFQRLLQVLQNNILNQKYTDEILQKFDSVVLSHLMKKYSNSLSNSSSNAPSNTSSNSNFNAPFNSTSKSAFNSSSKSSKFLNSKSFKNLPSTSDIQKKMDAIKKTQEVLRKFRSRSRRLSNLSQNGFNMTSTSKQFLGSKRNTQNAQNSKNNISTHSKKSSSGDCSVSGSEKNLNDSQKEIKIQTEINFDAIEEDQEELDEESSLSGPQRMLKALVKFGPKARRSKMFKPDEFNFHNSFRENSDDEQDRFERSKQYISPRKGLFRKAQKYLFDINMGKTIINKDDSIFTAKRKMRVLKVLLKENPTSPEADQLQNYVKEIEQKIKLKIQKEKKQALQKKLSQNEEIFIEQDVWKQVSLDNLGYNLIFYNLTSKFGGDENDDLCILLNEWKLHNVRRLDNQFSFKVNLVTDEEEIRKSKKKNKFDDMLIQEGMGNMEFQPKIESEKQIDLNSQSKRTTKTFRKSLMELNAFAKESKLSGFFGQNSLNQTFTEDELNGLNDSQIEAYYNQIKRMFKYAKIHFPETFDKYMKNSKLNNISDGFQNSEIDHNSFTY